MNLPAEHSAEANRRYREWMREQLQRAAWHFEVSVAHGETWTGNLDANTLADPAVP
jgi:hypothetical protein